MSEVFGKYEIVREVAQGGMAKIWLARHVGPQGFQRDVAIKRLLPEFSGDQEFVRMFLDEARLASSLIHPNIVQILELGESDGEHFIAMEFVDGMTLDEVLNSYAEDGPMPPAFAARIMMDVLEALDFAHQAKLDGEPLGLVHRDVTPSNVLVSNSGNVKLVDFGVAKAVNQTSETQAGAIKGKYPYMSPEQAQDMAVSAQSDIFSAGVTFYELLTGTKPFGDGLLAITAILREDPTPPRELRAAIPPAMSKIVMKALEKSLDLRYHNARAMILDLETSLRMMGAYVGPRELSILVLTKRGLSLPDEVDSSTENSIFAADRSGENPIRPLPETPPQSVSKRWIIIAALVLIVGILVATSLMQEGVPDGTILVLNETPLREPGADLNPLMEDGGIPVLITPKPSALVFRDGQYVGTSPIRAQLKPGDYDIQLMRGDEVKTMKISLGDSDTFLRMEPYLDDLPAHRGKKPQLPKQARPAIMKSLEKLMN